MDALQNKNGDKIVTPIGQKANEFGAWCTINNSFSAELVALLEFDYIVVDMQHGLIDYSSIVAILQAIELRKKTAMVRIPLGDYGLAQRVLDAGATAIIVPMVNDKDDAVKAVHCTKYPPTGERSFGPIRSQFVMGGDIANANSNVRCFVQIETENAVNNLEDILSVTGIDGTYIGPADLAISFGRKITERDEYLEGVIDHIRTATQSAGLQSAIHTTNGKSALQRINERFDLVSLGSDAIWLKNVYAREVAIARNQQLDEIFRYY
jgi:4-hydroxy-2-oxoheptanedioate aldolase